MQKEKIRQSAEQIDDGCTEVLVGQVQIDGGLFEVPMPKQDLNRAQVGARLQQMRCKAMP